MLKKIKATKATWDDMQMTDDLAANLKATFDEEQKKLEDAIKYPNDTAKNRATAPDFALIPFAKWDHMPIPYSVSLIRSTEAFLNLKTQDTVAHSIYF
uniref:ATP synthase subunit d, mitochondrial n=1 Tax=Romanomermis culicivorax TaxID=13658 RepID=A0A915L6H6_ROMCU